MSSNSNTNFKKIADATIAGVSTNVISGPNGTVSGSGGRISGVAPGIAPDDVATVSQLGATSGVIPIANGGTGQTTANAAFNALSPMTTGGDLIYGAAAGAATRLANGASGQILTSNGTTLAPSWQNINIIGSPTVMKAGLTANYAVAANAPIVFDTVTFDTAGAYSTLTGLYTVPTPGYYLVQGSCVSITASMGIYVAQNGSGRGYLASQATGAPGNGGIILLCAANDTIGIYSDATVTAAGISGNYYNAFYVSKIQPSASGSGIARSVISISTATTLAATLSTDYVYLVSGTTTATLPTAVSTTNKYTVKNVGVNTVTVNTTSSQTIDGSLTVNLTPNTSLDFISNGSNWNLI